MAFTGIGKLIKDLVTGTPADTDYFAFGNTDLKKVSFPNLKEALGIDALNSALENSIKTKEYKMKLNKNNYVAPFSYYGNAAIPSSDIATYGIPISISATGGAGDAIPVALFKSDEHTYMYSVTSGSENASVDVTFFKI